MVAVFLQVENSNHLGNVLVTISDKKLAVDSDGNGTVDYYNADVVTANDYYPFGMTMPGRYFSTTGKRSRHSINGQERSDELNDNLTTAKFWEYDSRIGRRWNVDPVVKVNESPYLCFSGNPITFSDPLGDVAVVRWRSGFLGLGRKHEAKYINGKWIDSKTGDQVNTSSNKKANRKMEDYSNLNKRDGFKDVTTKINESKVNVVLANSRISETDPNSNFREGRNGELIVNLRRKGWEKMPGEVNEGKSTVKINSEILMGHELGHVFDILNGKPVDFFKSEKSSNRYGGILYTLSKSEINAMYRENILRNHFGLPLRQYYLVEYGGGLFGGVSAINNDAIINTNSDGSRRIEDTDGNSYLIK